MKKVILFSLAALMLAACSQEENGGTMTGQQELRLTSSLEDATRGDVQSEQIVENETVWAWVSHVGKSGPEATLYNAVKLTAIAGGSFSSTKMYFPEADAKVDIRALHGTFADAAFEVGTTAFPESIGFTVAGDQSKGGDSYVKSDLLYTVANGQSSTGLITVVPLEFYHMLSKVELKIVKSSGVGYDIKSVTLGDVAVSGTFTPKTDADLTQQAARAEMIAAGEQTGTMAFGKTMSNGVTNDAIMVPQNISGKTMTFTLSDGSTLSHTFSDGMKLESGKRYIYTFTLKDNRLSIDSSIEPWDASEKEKDELAMMSDPLKPKIGDFFYSDGSYSATLDETKTAIGIVFQIDADRIGEAEKAALNQVWLTGSYGLVMALKKAATNEEWANVGESPVVIPELANCDTKEECNNDISGLYNYNAVIDYANTNNQTYPAFQAVQEFDVAAPGNTTGWFLPSAGQLYDFFANLGGLPDWSEGTGGESEISVWSWSLGRIDNYCFAPLKDSYDKFVTPECAIWTSTVYSSGYAIDWRIGDMEVKCCKDSESSQCDVRPILAFRTNN